jgi:hypothetical protein
MYIVADCGVPIIDSSLNLTYNSTLEGSELVVLCDSGFVVTAFCHMNGYWSPDLTVNTCHLQEVITGEKSLILCVWLLVKLMYIVAIYYFDTQVH